MISSFTDNIAIQEFDKVNSVTLHVGKIPSN